MTHATAHAASSVEPTTARELRMLTALLAACDPCEYVESGGSSDLYVAVALGALRRLHLGADAAELLEVFPGDADAVAATDFARCAIDWWREGRTLRSPALEQAVLGFAS